MKKTNLLILILIFSGIVTATAQTRIVVAIAQGETTCENHVADDLGYQIYSGLDNIAKLANLAESDVKRNNPDYIRIVREHNSYNGEEGNHLMIIESSMTYGGCDFYRYGVGFGYSRNEALNTAKKSLGMRNGNWQESKHGYNEVFYEVY